MRGLAFPPLGRAAPHWPRFPPCRRLPLLRGPASPLRRFPPCARPSLPPLAAPSSSPPCAAATLPPFARLPPLRAALPRRYADPRSASRRSGDGRPRFGHGPAAGAAWRGLRRGLAIPRPAVTPSASTAGLRVELARWRSLALRLGRCPRREDRRGSSRRSAALFRPAGFGWGRARRCGTRQPAASPTPPPIRAQATPSLTRVVQIRLTADFQRRLSVRAFQGHFLGKIGRFWAYGGPRASILPKKRPPKALQAACNSPRVSRSRKTRGHLLFGGLACQARTLDRARHRPDRASAFGTGVRPSAFRGMVSQSSYIF